MKKPSSASSHNRNTRWWAGPLALLFWLLVWQGLYLAVGKPYLLVSPGQTALRLAELAGEPSFWLSVLATCARVLAGFVLALAAGVALAFLSARFSGVRILFAPLLGIVRATPVASFIILALIWISTDRLPVFISFLMVLPMAYSNISAGIAALDRQLLEMARLFRFSRGRTLRLIYLPGLMPYVTSACTAGLGFAWKSTVAAEVIAHPALSIGKQIWGAKVYLEVADLLAWTVTVILMSVVIEKSALYGLRALERRLLRLQRVGDSKRHTAPPENRPLTARGVSKSYGELQVLQDFSLELAQPGVVALMGPSGCGKTTLLRLIAGLEPPDAGEIAGGGRASMVFQEDRLLPGLSARDNILAVLPGGGESGALADDLLEGIGLGEFAHRLPEELSGGMQRRVSVARAMAYGGDTLLLDEPFKGLDDATKEDIMAFMGRRMAGHTRCLLVTHDAREARRMADKILSLTGPPLEYKP